LKQKETVTVSVQCATQFNDSLFSPGGTTTYILESKTEPVL